MTPPAATVRVVFDPLLVLPSAPIEPGCGPVGEEFLARGVTTLRAAAVWLHVAPYGMNDADGPLAVFRDGYGTCETKHIAAVTLARELGVALEWIWGLYGLDDSVMDGAGAVLGKAGIPFVPNIHCFVRFDGRYVDLTEGNCTGKRGLIEEYRSLAEAEPGDDMAAARQIAAADLIASDDRFAGWTPTALQAVLADCYAASPLFCER
jgi:hypothetical protein